MVDDDPYVQEYAMSVDAGATRMTLLELLR
jgi:hypothetical protein